ncbi:hypothetical protein BGP_5180 [Beggiatoa sp. PS]|nr:hypothetical protein BGP_5180 [Beggiatoa sp. PS]
MITIFSQPNELGKCFEHGVCLLYQLSYQSDNVGQGHHSLWDGFQ